MAGVPPNTYRQNELPEFPIHGPFGGIQSELPVDLIEQYGFYDIQNLLLVNGTAHPFAGQRVNDGIMPAFFGPASVADFFNSQQARYMIRITPGAPANQQVFYFSQFNTVGTNLIGSLSSAIGPFSFAVSGGKLCFCQGVDKVKLWDGLGGNFTDAAVAAVPAKYLFELGNHLLALNCLTAVGGTPLPQRVFWTGAGDPTDWTSFNAGQNDLFNDLGPISGGIKLSQGGYIFQYFGITQAILTGIGTQPFNFQPLSRRGKGCPFPSTLSVYGDLAGYVGSNDVFLFDGIESIPIGGQPIDGRKHLGAHSRIMNDIQNLPFSTSFGVMTSGIRGFPFKAYWLFIGPAIWIYNLEEQTWTRMLMTAGVNQINASAPVAFSGAIVSSNSSIRIQDLIGTIGSQSWSPSTISSSTTQDVLVWSDSIGNLTATPIQQSSTAEQWSMTIPLLFGDARHDKTIKKVRLVYRAYPDNVSFSAPFTGVPITLQAKSDTGQAVSNSFTLSLDSNGNPIPSGTIVCKVLELSIAGRLIFLTLSSNYPVNSEGFINPPGNIVDIIELTPIYDVGGEARGS